MHDLFPLAPQSQSFAAALFPLYQPVKGQALDYGRFVQRAQRQTTPRTVERYQPTDKLPCHTSNRSRRSLPESLMPGWTLRNRSPSRSVRLPKTSSNRERLPISARCRESLIRSTEHPRQCAGIFSCVARGVPRPPAPCRKYLPQGERRILAFSRYGLPPLPLSAAFAQKPSNPVPSVHINLTCG